MRHITARVGDHKRQGIVERFNRTIEGMIGKYQEAHKTNRYIDILDFITENYNNSFHSIIKETPEQRHKNNPSTGILKSSAIDTDFSIGDKVRIAKDKKTFQKGYEPKYSISDYEIVSGNGYTFSLKNSDGLILSRKYKYYELQKINRIEKLLPNPRPRPKPATLAERRKKREIEDLELYTFPPLNKKRKIKKPIEVYTTGHRRKRESEDLAVCTMPLLNKRQKKSQKRYRVDNF